MAAPPLLAPSDFHPPVLHGAPSSSCPTGGNLPWRTISPPHVPPLAPPRASSTLCPHASLNRPLEPLSHPWKVKFHHEGVGEWGYRVSDSPPDNMPKCHLQLPLFRPQSSQVCAARARRQFLERRGGATGDLIFGEGLILLCDGCDKAIHAHCVSFRGPLHGDWLCSACRGKGGIRKRRRVRKANRRF